MRELHEVKPAPSTPEAIIRFGLSEIAHTAAGHHLDPDNPCYGEKRRYSDYAQRMLLAARDVDDGREWPERAVGD